MPSWSMSEKPSSIVPLQLSSKRLQVSRCCSHGIVHPGSAPSIRPSPSLSISSVQVASPGGPSWTMVGGTKRQSSALFSLLAVNQRLPSPPTVIQEANDVVSLGPLVGSRYSMSAPRGVSIPMTAPPVNHRFPPGPITRSRGTVPGVEYSVNVPSVVSLAIVPRRAPPSSLLPASHRSSSSPPMISTYPVAPLGSGIEVKLPAGVILPTTTGPGLAMRNHTFPSGPTVIEPGEDSSTYSV